MQVLHGAAKRFCVIKRRAVLHIDSESTWRGGENQMRLLLEHAPQTEWQWHLAAPPESEAIKRLGLLTQPKIQLVPLPMRGLKILPAAQQLARYVRAHGIELVDCQSSRAHNLGLLLKQLCPALKLVVHRRVDYPPGGSWFNRKKYLSPKIDRYVCISRAIASVLESYGVPRARLSVVPSAVDPGPFRQHRRPEARQAFARQWKIPVERPVIGNVAYLTEQKNHETLIAALGILKRKGHSFFAYIAGGGEREALLKELARREGLLDQELHFLGVRKDIPELLAATDIFALSSQDEGLGTSLLDAAHSGCTLVATAVGGIPELVLDGKTGLLAPAREPGAFAQQLERALGDASLRARLVHAAEAHALEHFSLESMVAGNLAVYRELLAP